MKKQDKNRLSKFQHAAARRRLASPTMYALCQATVSTRSRPKAAGMFINLAPVDCFGFNTQPPEGGWFSYGSIASTPIAVSTRSRPKAAGAKATITMKLKKFQHAAARRRLVKSLKTGRLTEMVSTRSRPKAAGRKSKKTASKASVSTRSRPKAAGKIFSNINGLLIVSTRSRPKAAGYSVSGW